MKKQYEKPKSIFLKLSQGDLLAGSDNFGAWIWDEKEIFGEV